MHNKTYDTASQVDAANGEVKVDGPDAVDVKLTPEAAEETGHRLLDGAMVAAGQRRLKDFPRPT